MKKIIAWLFILAALAFSIYYFQKPLAVLKDQWLYYSLCDQPITYRLGSIDSRFNLTNDEFQKDIEEADAIWNKNYPKPLFAYDPKALLSFNMVYDERQYLVKQVDQLGNNLTQEKNTIQPQIQQYDQQMADFNAKINNLNAQIEEWNKKGGAPPNVYKDLINQEQQLFSEMEKLKNTAQALNRSTQEYNQQVAKLNQAVKSLNQTLEVKPEEGLYDGNQQRIDIYFNVNQDELVHTLAHEMGHALGLDHNNNTDSIMYPKASKTLEVTNEDLQSLTLLCARRSKLEYVYERIVLGLTEMYSYFKSLLPTNFQLP